MDTAHWPQEIVVKPIEEIVTCTPKPVGVGGGGNNSNLERKSRPQKEAALNCPRCNSTNTKFCYYNNYSLTQPRYFCKTCRRYWTEGGSLRNIPVGGGSRKNKRSSSSSSSLANTTTPHHPPSRNKLPDLVTPTYHHDHHHHHQNPKNNNVHEGSQDLNLSSFPIGGFKNISDFVHVLPIIDNNNSKNQQQQQKVHNSSSNSNSTTDHLSALELLTGISTSSSSSRGFNNSFEPMSLPDHHHPNSVYNFNPLSSDFKPTLNFNLDGYGSVGNIGVHQDQETGQNNNGRLLFPFEDLKQVSNTTTDHQQNRDQNGDSSGYWTGMLGGGSW